MFTARNRQNAFANRRRQQREAAAAEAETTAILADADAMEAVAEAEAEPIAAPFDRNPESEEYVQAPDIGTYASGGIVEPLKAHDIAPNHSEPVFDLAAPEHGNISVPVVIPNSVIDADTQAKIDAVLSHAIPPVADEPVTPEKLLDEAAIRADTGFDVAPEPDAEEPKRGRGRPRPQETIERDNAVHALLVGADADTGISKESIAAELDEKEQQVYSSLRQLSKEGRAETRYVKPHGYRWFAL